MFKVDMDAICEAAIEVRLMANTARAANQSGTAGQPLAKSATLAISREPRADIDPVLADLLTNAMQVCDRWRDSDDAREQMRRECLETPPHLRADLLAHFRGTYPSCYERGKGEEVQKGQLRRR